MKKNLKLNIGCGETKLDGFINVDLEKKTKPDLLHDIRKGPLPIKSRSISEIYVIHNIEHIEYKYWEFIFREFFRVLKPNGVLLLAYPEFEKCAKCFLENYKGQKDFFRMTLYGRQMYPGDYHVTPMVTKDFTRFLLSHGFDNVQTKPESETEWYNTVLKCTKSSVPISREQLLKKEIFKK